MRPRIGMSYNDVLCRCKRLAGSKSGHPQAKSNLINSLRNQCRLAEGEKALSELDKELCSTNKPSSRCLTGAGNKQLGVCMKFDCATRFTDRCDSCIKGSAYTPKTLEGSALPENAGRGGRNA